MSPAPRPGVVTASAVMSIIGGALIVLLSLLVMIAGAAVMSEFADVAGAEFGGALTGIFVVVGIIMLVWGGLILLAAIFTMRRANWARWVLIVMGALSVLLSLIGMASAGTEGIGFNLIGIVYVGLAAGLLLTTPDREWFAGASGTQGQNFNPAGYSG